MLIATYPKLPVVTIHFGFSIVLLGGTAGSTISFPRITVRHPSEKSITEYAASL
jgi:hypothetical protein